MALSLNIQFERSGLSDVTHLKAWTADSETLPSEVFLYEYDNVEADYTYSRVCRYADLVNWGTARKDVNDRYIRKAYAYVSAYTDATINNMESGIRSQVSTLLSDMSGCTDGPFTDAGFSGSSFSLSGIRSTGTESSRVDISTWMGGSAWPCLVIHNEHSGLAVENSGAFLSVATVRDMEDIGVSGFGSGALWRASSGTVVLPNARVSEFMQFVSGDLQDLFTTPAWSGVNASGYHSPAGSVYL